MNKFYKSILLLVLIVIFGGLCLYLGQNMNKENLNGYFVEQGFSFEMPENWSQTYELGPFAILNQEEEGDFKSYVIFVRDDLNGRTLNQYFDYTKTKLDESLEEFEVLEEIDFDNVHTIKGKTTQEDINYIISIAFVEGINDTCWVLSLNTLEENFDTVNPIFENVFQTFNLR